MMYRVTWVIDVVAESPREAAEQAQRIQRDPHSWATVFEVTDREPPEADPVTIDMMDET